MSKNGFLNFLTLFLFFIFLRNDIVILFMVPLRQGLHKIKVGEHPPSTLYIR